MAIRSGMRVTKDEYNKLIESVEALTKNKVMVGVPSTTAGRKDGPASNAVIGYVQEFGSPKLRIPPRPFLVPGIIEAKDALVVALKHAADIAMTGNKQATIKALHAVGMVAQAAVKNKMRKGPFIPLSPYTLRMRRLRGVKRTKPLIDTGDLINSIKYVLRGRWF